MDHSKFGGSSAQCQGNVQRMWLSTCWRPEPSSVWRVVLLRRQVLCVLPILILEHGLVDQLWPLSARDAPDRVEDGLLKERVHLLGWLRVYTCRAQASDPLCLVASNAHMPRIPQNLVHHRDGNIALSLSYAYRHVLPGYVGNLGKLVCS